jgi:nicotinamidase-related amidase
MKLGVDTLVFAGCNFPNCLRASIYEASERDFKIVLVEDAVSGLYQKGKGEMTTIGVQVTNAEAVRKAIIQWQSHARKIRSAARSRRIREMEANYDR